MTKAKAKPIELSEVYVPPGTTAETHYGVDAKVTFPDKRTCKLTYHAPRNGRDNAELQEVAIEFFESMIAAGFFIAEPPELAPADEESEA